MEWKVKELSRQNIDFVEYPLSKLEELYGLGDDGNIIPLIKELYATI